MREVRLSVSPSYDCYDLQMSHVVLKTFIFEFYLFSCTKPSCMGTVAIVVLVEES